MATSLTLDWQKATDGYEVVEFDPAGITWTASRHDGWKVHPPSHLPARMSDLLEKWGMHLEPGADDPYEPFRVVVPLGTAVLNYDPMAASTSAYVEFINTPPTEDGVVSFTNRFGMLRRGMPARVDQWLRDLDLMKSAIAEWDGMGDDITNTYMAKLNNRWHDIHMTLRLGVDGGASKGPSLVFGPHDLLGAMWAQLSLAVVGLVAFKGCSQCGNVIEVKPGTNRPDRLYCGDACRMRAYRLRKLESNG